MCPPRCSPSKWVFAGRARELFGVERSYLAIQSLDTGVAAELVRNEEASVAFDGVHDLERWDVRLRHGSVETAWFAFDPDLAPASDADASPLGEKCVLVALRRAGQRVRPLSRADQLKQGDLVFVALHRSETEAATRALAARGLRLAPQVLSGEAEREGIDD